MTKMFVFLGVVLALASLGLGGDPKLHLITVATEETDGFRRLQASAKLYGHNLHVLGMGQTWQGGSMQGLGGGQKIRLLKEYLIDQNFDSETIILFVDAYDVIITAFPTTILRRFLVEFPDKRILFGAESFCWPDKTLAPKYPLVTFGERFLNSGLILGYAPELLELLENADIFDHEDDQLFYTKLYLDEKIRTDLKIGLDSISRIFFNLNGATDEAEVEFDDDGQAQIFHKSYNTHPAVIHGNGPSKIYLNFLENYVAGGFNKKIGCQKCQGTKIKSEMENYPTITLAVIIGKSVPYVEEFFENLAKFNYPKKNIDLFIYNNQKRNVKEVNKFVEDHRNEFRSVKVWGLESGICEYSARNEAFHHALVQNSEFIFLIDPDVHLKPDALTKIVQRAQVHDLRVLTPMVAVPEKLFTNFWGAVSDTGFYARSSDYVDIVEGTQNGFWNVPFVTGALLIAREKLPLFLEAYEFDRKFDPDMSFAFFCRDRGHFMYVDNEENYGFLVISDNFGNIPEDYLNAELYDYPNNKELWEKRYIHPEYKHYISEGVEVPLACPDVYDFPFVSLRFCREIIEIMENYGRWSDGSNYDRRLDGGYENVPTRDIHMNQVGFDKQWLQIMDDYVAPMQEKTFIGFYQRPVKSNMMFVVRYRPDEQASLRPHHDASTYSIDIALNKKGVDYEGGGVRYVRYNCTVPADEPGWSMLFPGRLTHLHEGLLTTKGTRYILFYWNVPSTLCKNENVLNPEDYDIVTNTNQTFLGDKILTFYESNLGLYPRLVILNSTGEEDYIDDSDPETNSAVVKVINGGIPQKTNLFSHLKKVRMDISKYIKKKKKFSGLLIIDYEAWRPLWEMNYGNKRIYQMESINWVKERYPGISDRFATEVAEKEFNRAAKRFMLRTIKTIRRLLPKAKIGFYGFPSCNYDAGRHKNRCSRRQREANRKLHWLFEASSALFPSIYYYNGNKMDKSWRERNTHARIMEALIVKKNIGKEIPIYPFTMFYYDDIDYYNETDVCLSTVQSAGYGIEGLIIWSSSRNMKTRCPGFKDFFENNYGPKIQELTEIVSSCNKELCNDNGICIRKKLNPPFECGFKAWTKEKYKCYCNPGFVGEHCDFQFEF
ncbi:hypothetical protein FO519_004662 [Halicephalobus sp. NKZ332]|nr:hypothetical protein FO519_004662 [Halicephalobus sp. NKZ332]